MPRQLLSLILLAVMVINSTSSNVFAQPGKERADLIVLGGTIVTMDQTRRVIENGAIAIARGRIVGIGPIAEIEAKFEAHQKIDASGRVIIPGLINGHTHIPMTL